MIGLGPMLWLAKSAITPTTDTITHPMALFPHGMAWGNLREAWSTVQVSRYFWNTVVLAIGSWSSQIVVATTGRVRAVGAAAEVRAVITGLLLHDAVRARGRAARAAVHRDRAPAADPPLVHRQLLGDLAARRRERVQRGAASSGSSTTCRARSSRPRASTVPAPFRLFCSIVLPMSRPILGVVSVFAMLASWKDFLWPLLVLTDPDKQPLSVRLPTIQAQTELGVFLAALFIASLVPIIGFLIFQRSFLRGAGLGGAIKG